MADAPGLVTAGQLVADPALAAELAGRGFCSAGVLYDEDARAELAAIYDEGMRRFGVPVGGGWLPTLALADPAARAWFSDGIRSVASRALAPILAQGVAEVWAGEFGVKPPGEASMLGYHQDASVTDERSFRCINTWASLTPSRVVNGAMRFVPGSQNLENPNRITIAPTSFAEVDAALAAHEVVVEAEPGEVLLFDARIVHRTLPNRTEEPRITARALIKPREAPLRFYFVDDATPPGVAEVFEMDERFCLDHGVLSRPREGTATAIGTVPWQQLTGEGLERAVARVLAPGTPQVVAVPDAAVPVMPSLFDDPVLQERFDRHGFVVVPFLSDAELGDFWAYYESLEIPMTGHVHLTVMLEDPELRHRVSAEVMARFRAGVERYMSQAELVVGLFFVKPPGQASAFEAHHDWTMVDQQVTLSAKVWCPLVDTDVANGTLHVVPGSHRVGPTLCGRNIPKPIKGFEREVISEHVVPVPLRRGEAIIFDNRLVHYSPPNETGADRPVASAFVTPKGAQLVYYFVDDAGQLRKRNVDGEFFEHLSYDECASIDPEGSVVVPALLQQFRPGDLALREAALASGAFAS